MTTQKTEDCLGLNYFKRSMSVRVTWWVTNVIFITTKIPNGQDMNPFTLTKDSKVWHGVLLLPNKSTRSKGYLIHYNLSDEIFNFGLNKVKFLVDNNLFLDIFVFYSPFYRER